MSIINKKYWILQLTGWFIYGSVGLLIAAIFAEITGRVVAMQLFAILVMLLTTHLLRHIIKKNQWTNYSIGGSIARVLITNSLLSLIANGMVTAFGIFVGVISLENYSAPVFIVYWFQTFVFLALWGALYMSIKYFRTYKQQEIEKWKLEAAVKNAELIALKAQINPHFLFNALNNIRGLILEDQMKARSMVDNLAELLRYSIQFNNQEMVTVKEEMEIVNKYLELESIHYENRLEFEIDIPTHLESAKVPPMIIQLMVENAIKHGISLQKNGGVIGISIYKDVEHILIEVSNTGQLLANNQDGIGIKNAMERINLLFEEMPNFELSQKNNLVVAALNLPHQK